MVRFQVQFKVNNPATFGQVGRLEKESEIKKYSPAKTSSLFSPTKATPPELSKYNSKAKKMAASGKYAQLILKQSMYGLNSAWGPSDFESTGIIVVDISEKQAALLLLDQPEPPANSLEPAAPGRLWRLRMKIFSPAELLAWATPGMRVLPVDRTSLAFGQLAELTLGSVLPPKPVRK